MPALRDQLAEAGFEDVSTYLQSGNVVLSSQLEPDALRVRLEKLVAKEFDLETAVLTRTRDELAEIVSRNPLAKVAKNPKRYQVTFLSSELGDEKLEALRELASPDERLEAIGRELYAWHPDGIARSKLWNRLAGKTLGVTATARNWTTVLKLLELADG